MVDRRRDPAVITPGPFATEIWDQPGNAPADYDGPLEPPSVAAEAICAALVGDAFETYVPDLKGVAELKTTDIDTFLESVAAFAAGPGDGDGERAIVEEPT